MSTSPYVFDEFFASGKEESISPFLTPSSRAWGKNIPLKAACLSAFFLSLALVSSLAGSPLAALFLLLVYFLSGTPALLGAIDDIRNLEINIDVLMTLAALLSVLIGSALEGALLLVLFEFSGAMEKAVAEKTKGTLMHLHQLSPRMGCLIGEGGVIFEKSVKEIPIGAHLLIKAGELIPLDGIVIEGSSSINLSHLTGEAQPVPKKGGDEVPSGARNCEGTLTLRVTRTSNDSTLSRIIQLILQAQEAKPRLQRLFDRFGKWYAITIMALFFLFAATLSLFFEIPYLGEEGGIYRALTFLIAASPCALIIATPTAYLSALSSCARKGILLKGGVILDALTRCSRIAFDKTGTLTTGELSCVAIEKLGDSKREDSYTVEEALTVANALERHAVHPIAEAIQKYAQKERLPPCEISAFLSVPGYGLQGFAHLHGKTIPVFIGHASFIAQHLTESAKGGLAQIPRAGHLHTLLLIEKSLFVFYFLDTLRPQSKEMIHTLKTHAKIQPLMLTGDHRDIAESVASQLGIEEVHAALRPEDKLEKVAMLAKTSGLIMVGDGINDAPALARATVGISLGKIGSRAAIDASDAVFLHDDLSLLSWLLDKAHHTLHIVKQNIALALAVILLATTPALLGFIPLWLAVILHEGGTVLVGFNSLRLLRSKQL